MLKDQPRIAPGALAVFTLAHVFLLLVIMAAGRLSMLMAFAEPGSLDGHGYEIWAMWRVGALFDLRTATIGLIPLYALGLASCFYDRAAWLFTAAQKIWSPFLYFAISLATVVNIFYYRTFHNEIDISIFGVINDGTKAVMTAVFVDYPSVRVILLVTVVTYAFSYLTRRILRLCQRWEAPASVKSFISIKAAFGLVLLLAFTAAYIVGVRGTLRPTPLRQHDRMVSNVPLLNKAVPNGLMALNWAFHNYSNTPPYQPVTQEDGQELAMAAFRRGSLKDKTPENAWLAKNPPHVVMMIMEGFGANLLEFDTPGVTDLLGSFRRHMGEDFVFRRFVSEENFTMPALARQFFFCPDESISRGKFKSVRLSGTPFDVYKQNGYETVFIYPGHGAWHDIRSYLFLHGVDRTYFLTDFFDLYEKEKPNVVSRASARGLPDEYIFPLVREILEKSDKPMFIVILTLTNHLPDTPPHDYVDRYPINPGPELLDKLNAPKGVKLNMLRSYQYANNCVGDFVSGIKDGPLGNRTVMAGFGDHRVINVKAKYPADLFLNRAVPFWLYVPKPVLANTPHRYAPERIGSNKDILPTLYSLSLSGADYYSVGGRNLLAEQDDPARAFGINTRLFINADGVCPLGEDYTNNWYAYGNGMSVSDTPQPMPDAVSEKICAYEQVYRWQINARAAGIK